MRRKRRMVVAQNAEAPLPCNTLATRLLPACSFSSKPPIVAQLVCAPTRGARKFNDGPNRQCVPAARLLEHLLEYGYLGNKIRSFFHKLPAATAKSRLGRAGPFSRPDVDAPESELARLFLDRCNQMLANPAMPIRRNHHQRCEPRRQVRMRRYRFRLQCGRPADLAIEHRDQPDGQLVPIAAAPEILVRVPGTIRTVVRRPFALEPHLERRNRLRVIGQKINSK